MGLRPSPYVSVRGVLWLKEESHGDPSNPETSTLPSTTPLVGTAATMVKATEGAAAPSDLEDSRKRPAEKSLTDIEVPPAAVLETNQRIKSMIRFEINLRSNGVAANDASKVAYPTIVKNIYNELFKEDSTLLIQPVSEWPAMFEASENRPKNTP